MTSPINPEAPKDPSEELAGIQPTAPHDSTGVDNSSFAQMLQSPKGPGALGSASKALGAGGTSPMQLPGMGRAIVPQKANLNTVLGAMDGANSLSNEVKGRLEQTKPSDLDRSKQFLLNEKLQQANQHIASVAQEAGVDPASIPIQNTSGKGPIARFMALLDHGQKMLQSATDNIPELAKGGQISPADFLSMQMRMSTAMVELDFSSQLLGKTGDAISKLMNVNI